MNIGDKIKEQRLKKELTQAQLSELLNVSRSTVSSWEVGRNYPDLETIIAISDLFGISLDNLLREDTEMTKDLSKKMKWNMYYKRILIIIGIVVLVYSGFNGKLRLDEQHYLKNLKEHSWKQDDYRDSASYSIKEEGVLYATYIIKNGFNPIPLPEHDPWVIARKENLVVKVNKRDKKTVYILKDNDPKVEYDAAVEVDSDGNIIKSELNWSDEKEEFLKEYLKKYQKEYVELLKRTTAKRQEVVG
ncbi:hypothetical protein UAY_03023 [Enterococcus moraviensis ATCC BAA-383]|uniref:HTH cro/C1-type domain-containing protein n=1 Tax=Enterococcus moraviensis ATCC BAA-383 TaxID=1158609 RepID=R2QLL4_9ENTE|nr:helix-turn-helix transcriptional regulator [Enterococcus moraviensis]EOH96113.1 hypothetical protein UAY_03023 [Enterococcus moraviensis ATCC BAA-383]EOT66085.1 hypothetical protein I586_02356 [Enterococcus moraviensis ATCC BAA-383]OJG65774.1 hypothetical protein RV09_GL001114 [Enterococcus moraviensis]